MPAMKRCPRNGCWRAGHDVGNCGAGVTPCPKPRPVKHTEDVVLRIKDENGRTKTFAVPAVDIVRGLHLTTLTTDNPNVAVVHPTTKSAPKRKPKKSTKPPEDAPPESNA